MFLIFVCVIFFIPLKRQKRLSALYQCSGCNLKGTMYLHPIVLHTWFRTNHPAILGKLYLAAILYSDVAPMSSFTYCLLWNGRWKNCISKYSVSQYLYVYIPYTNKARMQFSLIYTIYRIWIVIMYERYQNSN